MRRERTFLLSLFFAVLIGAPFLVWINIQSDRVISDPIFDLPDDIPYVYVELDESVLGGKKNRIVVLLYYDDGKVNRIGAVDDNGKWKFSSSSENAERRLDSAIQNHMRKVRLIPEPLERPGFGKIFASDAGLLVAENSRRAEFKAEISGIGENEWEMKVELSNIELLVPRTSDFAYVRMRDFPNIDGTVYGRFAANLGLFKFLNLKGEVYATIGEGNAKFEGLRIPAVLSRFYLDDKGMINQLFNKIHDICLNRYDYVNVHGGLYSPAPLSLWMTEASAFAEFGIIDESKISGDFSSFPTGRNSIFWLQVCPRLLLDAFERSLLRINPKLSLLKNAGVLKNMDSLSVVFYSLGSGRIRWKLHVNQTD